METLLPARRPRSTISLGRHQTFHLRAGWLVKALDALAEDPEALSLPDSHHRLGVGKNMLEAIRYWTITADLAEDWRPAGSRRSQLNLTDLGKLLRRHDPYFEDAASLWAVHTTISSAWAAPAWYWLFNESDAVAYHERELLNAFAAWLAEMEPEKTFSEVQIRRELSCLRRTYLHEIGGPKSSALDDQLTCPLSSLGLLKRGEDGGLQMRLGSKQNLPLDLVVFALHRFARDARPDSRTWETFSLDDLRWNPGSPGRLFALDASTLWDMLAQAQVHVAWGLKVTHTAGLRTVEVHPTDPASILDGYYVRHAS